MNHLLQGRSSRIRIPSHAAPNRRGKMEAATSNPPNRRIALVTGGNKGIGLETCRQLASRGLRVLLTARNEARGLEAVEEIRRSSGGGHADVVFHQLDVTDPSSAARLADFVRDQFGRLDILVNNAGISGVDRDPVLVAKIKDQIEGMDVEQRVEWMRENSKETYEEAKECMRTNYYGAKHVTEALLPLLLLSSSGRVVNVSSGFGLLRNFNSEEFKKEFDDIENLTEKRLDELLDLFLEDFKANLIEAHGWPTGGSSAYKVAKAALNAYTRILAKKHPTLRINCLTPGYVKSDMSMHMGVLTPEEGASNTVKVALLPGDGPTGAYFDRNDTGDEDADVIRVALFRRCLVTVRHYRVGSRIGYVDEEDDFRIVGIQSCVRLPSLDTDVCIVFASLVPSNEVFDPIHLGCVNGVITFPRRH